MGGLGFSLVGALLLGIGLGASLPTLPVYVTGVGFVAFGQLLLCVTILMVGRGSDEAQKAWEEGRRGGRVVVSAPKDARARSFP